MAPPPEYDKEPKAPDKSATNISTEDSNLLNDLVNDQHTYSDHKSTNTATPLEVENKKHVETLDDGQLKALLDEAINYKNPKDREGKSEIFKELLEKAEQESDEQACKAAARSLTGCRSSRRGGRRGPPLPHSNSLQDLVAELSAEPPRKHHVRHHPPPNVSARTHHGGSLPSGVDTSSLSEEPPRGANYLATVRCVNPPPLAERRVSASDANTPAEMELLNRSKPVIPMTYTARATLEIGSGAVCSGRAVTTTTPSNQVRTSSARQVQVRAADPQRKLLSALCPGDHAQQGQTDNKCAQGKTDVPRGPKVDIVQHDSYGRELERGQEYLQKCPQSWVENVDNWYRTIPLNYPEPIKSMGYDKIDKQNNKNEMATVQTPNNNPTDNTFAKKPVSTQEKNIKQKENDDAYRNPRSSPKYTKKEIQNVSPQYFLNYKDNDAITGTQTYSDIEKAVTKRKKTNKFGLVVPTLSDLNPRNIRPMSIGTPKITTQDCIKSDNIRQTPENETGWSDNNMPVDINLKTLNLKNTTELNTYPKVVESSNFDQLGTIASYDTWKKQLQDHTNINTKVSENVSTDIELKEIKTSPRKQDTNETFAKFVAKQQKLLVEVETEIPNHKHETNLTDAEDRKGQNSSSELSPITYNKAQQQATGVTESKEDYKDLKMVPLRSTCVEFNEILEPYCVEDEIRKSENSDNSAELSNNAYVLLTLPSSINTQIFSSQGTSKLLRSGKKKDNLLLTSTQTNKTREDVLHKNILRVLLFENLFKNNDKESPGPSEGSAIANHEVDSAISFSCITSPEVVAGCDTTPCTTQAAVAIDAKPLQLGSCYRAVASITGAPATPRAELPPPGDAPDDPPADLQPADLQTTDLQPADSGPATRDTVQPRNVITSNFNGLPLTRPNYGSTGTSAPDDYKKSIDENGNSLQGFSSPLSGSSQHKKPRRKKSSKNETVIDCRQIDGYRGDKNVDELLRFIESNVERGRGAKLARVKHKDDDDKGKKRSAERRKDKRPQRASSLEELSRTSLGELTRRAAPPPERRSWGDEREPDPPAELTDFQTVTKRRRARRRHERDAPRHAAPRSDRSNDSNDDLDSVHSLPDAPRAPLPAPPPATPPAPAHHASYADIARIRHNIPDLIESCNFYAEGEGTGAPDPVETPAPAPTDSYPALEQRVPAVARRRDAKPAAPAPRRERKERDPADGDSPAPDVVGEGRPPVILLDSAVRGRGARDMDGITFGFDVNEQLLSGGARRARCDLLRDALPATLRYVPPAATHDHMHLMQIVDYVGSAWEDVMRCGSGKVRYFSE